MGKDNGTWAKIYRDLLDEELWTSEPFTTGQAWVDLILMANYADTEKIYKGKLQVVKRGQIATSIRALALRWHWSREKTNRTIKTFENAKMLTVNRTTNGTIINLENYEKFQSGRTTKPATTSATTSTTTQATTSTHNKNIKNIKEPKELHGAYANVALSGGEYQDLVSLYGEETLADLIEALSEYKEATGKNYKNDAAAVRTFARNRTPKREESSFSKEY